LYFCWLWRISNRPAAAVEAGGLLRLGSPTARVFSYAYGVCPRHGRTACCSARFSHYELFRFWAGERCLKPAISRPCASLFSVGLIGLLFLPWFVNHTASGQFPVDARSRVAGVFILCAERLPATPFHTSGRELHARCCLCRVLSFFHGLKPAFLWMLRGIW